MGIIFLLVTTLYMLQSSASYARHSITLLRRHQEMRIMEELFLAEYGATLQTATTTKKGVIQYNIGSVDYQVQTDQITYQLKYGREYYRNRTIFRNKSMISNQPLASINYETDSSKK